MTPDEARKVLEDEQRARLAEFQRKLEALLKEYGVRLEVQQIISVVDVRGSVPASASGEEAS